jgi:hypothetical protein
MKAQTSENQKPEKKEKNYYNIPKDQEYVHGTWTLEGNAALIAKQKRDEIKRTKGSCGYKRAINALLCELYNLKHGNAA